jgi:hypothetical protein
VTSICTLTSSTPANYRVTFNGTSGAIVHQVFVTVHVIGGVSRSTSTTVVCAPGSVAVNQASSCTAFVKDTAAGTTSALRVLCSSAVRPQALSVLRTHVLSFLLT